MTHIYRVSVARSKPEYCGDRRTTDQRAQALADETNETATIEICRLIDLSRTSIACALLNGKDWCAHHRILAYVKPRQQERAA